MKSTNRPDRMQSDGVGEAIMSDQTLLLTRKIEPLSYSGLMQQLIAAFCRESS